ncbi:MAG: response regulator transcription factor [Clostridia bacterium]|nr:response regulator transcription factor [Clostridia bacterium]
MAKILIAEDELPINDLIKKNLRLVGHECTQVFDGDAAVRELENAHYDLLILDVMLPGQSGFEVIGQANGTPVIFVTAKDQLSDRLRGLRLGAEDYIVKPFEILELVERVHTVLRRFRTTPHAFSFDDVTVDFDSRTVSKGGKPVDLTPKEFDLLEAFVVNRNLALSRDRLLALVWSYGFDGDGRTVDTHVQRLRKKLGIENRLKTVYKLGYRLEVNDG